MKTAITLLAFAALALAQGDVIPRWYSKSTPPATTYVTTEVCCISCSILSISKSDHQVTTYYTTVCPVTETQTISGSTVTITYTTTSTVEQVYPTTIEV